MKRLVLLLLAGIAIILSLDSCVMRYPKGTPYQMHGKPQTDTRRHFGAKKNYWQRREMRGRGRSGPRPHSYRGRYH